MTAVVSDHHEVSYRLAFEDGLEIVHSLSMQEDFHLRRARSAHKKRPPRGRPSQGLLLASS
jgi:hypothetical protein